MNKKSNQNENQRIQVFARCRPLNASEKKESRSVVDVIPDKKIVVKAGTTNREFLFDKVFPPTTNQLKVYKAVVEPLIHEVLMGYNCTVFAYGQTGTGKTFAMEGERTDSSSTWYADSGAGIIPRALHQLFEELEKEENIESSVRVSFLELYNEELFDLRNSTGVSKLRLLNDQKGSVNVHGLIDTPVNNKDEVYDILREGSARRQTSATMLNDSSSRSHTVFSVTVHIKENTIEGEELLKTGKLNLVDLAGSENVKRSDANNKQTKEAGSINQSLLTLGRVITSLIEKAPHIPYRESKLTRILQDSLGGHTKTSIIATISPAACNLEETISTLDYATKAKSITIKPVVNEIKNKRMWMKAYTEEIERLQKDLLAQRNKDGFYIDSENYANLLASLEEKKSLIDEFEKKVDVLVEENKKIEDLFSCTKEEKETIAQQLNEVKALYDTAIQELNEKTEVLHCTQKALEKASLERDEKQYLIDVKMKKEKELTQQAQTLLHVANESTDDVNKLYEKIDRKNNVDKTNEEHYKNFRTAHQQQCRELNSFIEEDKQKEVCFLQNLKENLEKFITSQFTGFQQALVEQLNGISTSGKANMKDFSLHLTEETSNQKQWKDALVLDLDSQKNTFSAEENNFLNEVLPSIFHKLTSANATVFRNVSEKYKEMCDKIIHTKSFAEAQNAKEKQMLSNIIVHVESFRQNQQMVIEDLRKHSALASEARNEKNKIMQAIALSLNNYFEKDKEEEKHLNMCEQSEAKLGELKQNLEPFLQSIRCLEEENANKNLSEFDRLCDIIKFKELEEMEQTLTNQHNAMSAEVTNFMESSTKVQEANFEKLKGELENLDQMLKTQQENNDSKIKEYTSVLLDSVNKVKVDIHQSSKVMQELIKDAKISLDKSEARRNDATAEVQDAIHKLDMVVEKFLSEDLVTDLPTGTTPQRKLWYFPEKIVTFTPPDKVLKTFRARRAEDTSLAMNLPFETSFNESDEMKDTSPASTTRSTSVASDDSVENESDSNASSVSDASINKENLIRRKKPRSRLPKKTNLSSINKSSVFNNFAKPFLPEPKNIQRKPFNSNVDLTQSDA